MEQLFGLRGLMLLGFIGLICVGWYLCHSGVHGFRKCRENDLPDRLLPGKPVTITLMVLGFFLIISGITPLGAFLAQMIS